MAAHGDRKAEKLIAQLQVGTILSWVFYRYKKSSVNAFKKELLNCFYLVFHAPNGGSVCAPV